MWYNGIRKGTETQIPTEMRAVTDTTATWVAERSRDVYMKGTDRRVGDQGHNGGTGGRAYSHHMGNR